MPFPCSLDSDGGPIHLRQPLPEFGLRVYKSIYSLDLRRCQRHPNVELESLHAFLQGINIRNQDRVIVLNIVEPLLELGNASDHRVVSVLHAAPLDILDDAPAPLDIFLVFALVVDAFKCP